MNSSTPRHHTLLAALVAASLVAALGACSASTPTPSASPESGAPQSTDSAMSTQDGTGTAPAELPDPHTLTGASTVTPLPDPEPVATDPTPVLPVTVTDVEGNTVTVTDTSRILALDLYGTLSRTVIALGLGDSIVGRTVSSTEERLADLPVVTSNGHSLNAEAILSLSPTVILADRSVGPPEVIDQIRAAGVPVVLVDPQRSVDGTDDLIRTVAGALGLDAVGDELVARVDASIADAKARIAQWTPATPLDAAFLYVRGTAGVFFILGPDEGAGELITGVGARDLAGEKGLSGLTPANAESLVALDPEVILVMEDGLESTNGLDGLLARPGVAQTRAGAHQRVIVIPDGIALAFGPQTGDVLLAVARALYGVDMAEGGAQ